MNELEQIEQFESGAMGIDSFHHADHVRIAFCYLRTPPLLDSLQRFSLALKAFADRCGKPGLYHETITWAYMLLINERMNRGGRNQDWEAFAAANSDLFIWKGGVLSRYYTETTLQSELARSTFILPDNLRTTP